MAMSLGGILSAALKGVGQGGLLYGKYMADKDLVETKAQVEGDRYERILNARDAVEQAKQTRAAEAYNKAMESFGGKFDPTSSKDAFKLASEVSKYDTVFGAQLNRDATKLAHEENLLTKQARIAQAQAARASRAEDIAGEKGLMSWIDKNLNVKVGEEGKETVDLSGRGRMMAAKMLAKGDSPDAIRSNLEVLRYNTQNAYRAGGVPTKIDGKDVTLKHPDQIFDHYFNAEVALAKAEKAGGAAPTPPQKPEPTSKTTPSDVSQFRSSRGVDLTSRDPKVKQAAENELASILENRDRELGLPPTRLQRPVNQDWQSNASVWLPK